MIKCVECGKKCRGDEIHYHPDADGPLCEECYKMYEEHESVQGGAIR
jgi:hypothetical protein